MNDKFIWAWNKQEESTGRAQWPSIQGQANLHDHAQITHQPRNQPQLYAMNPDQAVDLMADLSPSVSRSVSPVTPRLGASEMRERAQRGYDGNLTTLSTPDSPTRRHELRHYNPAPWMPASPTGNIMGATKPGGEDPSAWRGRRKEGDDSPLRRVSPTTRPKAQRHSVLETGQKVVGGSVTVSGIGTRVRDLHMDEYGGARIVWRSPSPGREQKTGTSPFRRRGSASGRADRTPDPKGTNRQSRKGWTKPWGTPDQGRSGDSPESPHFGAKDGSGRRSGSGIGKVTKPRSDDRENATPSAKKDDEDAKRRDKERSPITIKPVMQKQDVRKADSDRRRKDDRDEDDRRGKAERDTRRRGSGGRQRDEYEDSDRSSKGERARRDR
jgi:hypothetical protein